VKSSNESGQAYAFMAMTPIVQGEEAALRSYIEGIPRSASPFAKLPRTHLARWVILENFHNEEEQGKDEQLRSQYLIFTANLDGPLDTYLDELCERLADEAAEIWGRCHGCPRPAAGEPLKRYLLHNQIDTSLFFAAYGEASVAQVVASLEQRERMIAFAIEAQGLAPEELQRRFGEEFAA
jgi:hypothetical protein